MDEIATTASAEPEPTFTLAQFQGVIRDLAAYERASCPVVLHGPEAYPAPATSAVQAPHPGVDIRVPGPPSTFTVDRPRNIWPLVFMVSGCTGLAACATAAATGSAYAILAFFAAVAVWGTATYHLVFKR